MTVRIAVVDSGIHPDHPHFARVKAGVFFDKGIESPDFVDRLRHGTAVAAVIHEKAPKTDIAASILPGMLEGAIGVESDAECDLRWSQKMATSGDYPNPRSIMKAW
jgi:hypothetical protein